MNKQMKGQMENLPILQDFVPYRGCCPKTRWLLKITFQGQQNKTNHNFISLLVWRLRPFQGTLLYGGCWIWEIPTFSLWLALACGLAAVFDIPLTKPRTQFLYWMYSPWGWIGTAGLNWVRWGESGHPFKYQERYSVCLWDCPHSLCLSQFTLSVPIHPGWQ